MLVLKYPYNLSCLLSTSLDLFTENFRSQSFGRARLLKSIHLGNKALYLCLYQMSRPKNLGDGNNYKQMVCIPEQSVTVGAGAIVDYKESEGPSLKDNAAEDLEIKLRRIIENVPLRVNNTSGSSAGSGSGDFHQYRQMRRREQDRLARMDADYEKRKELEEFNARREERIKAAEERTAKKRAKRQKKKEKKQKKKKTDSSVSGQPENVRPDSAEEDSFDSDSADEGQRRPIVKQGYQSNLS